MSALGLKIQHEAEDGLDPTDALTPEEALARILVLIAGRTVQESYDDHTIQNIMRWGNGEGGRAALEDAGLISRWA